MKKMCHVLFWMFAAVIIYPAEAKEGPDILQIFDAFILSSAAARKCVKPDEEVLANYLANFRMISIRAAQELQKRFPDKTKEQIGNVMRKNSELLTEKVDEVIDADGCENEKIDDLIKRFYLQAKWEPYKK
jgi:mevalonate kinase